MQLFRVVIKPFSLDFAVSVPYLKAVRASDFKAAIYLFFYMKI
jgi:hypothetical protein